MELRKIHTLLLLAAAVLAVYFLGNTAPQDEKTAAYGQVIASPWEAGEDELRYAFRQLTAEQQADYLALVDGMIRMQPAVSLPYPLSGEDYSRIYLMIIQQEPELFFLSPQYRYAKRMTEAELKYEHGENEVQMREADLLTVAEKLLPEAVYAYSDYEKALYVHDTLVAHCSYDEEAAGDSTTVYGCLVKQNACCEGYAKAFVYLSRRLGLQAVVVTGQTADGTLHAWNLVELDGVWYQVDVTWDDPVGVEGDTIRHTYFCAPNALFLKSHTPQEDTFSLPDCADSEGYFAREGLLMDSMSTLQGKLSGLLVDAVESGGSCVEFQCADEAAFSEIRAQLMDAGGIFEILQDVDRALPERIDASQYLHSVQEEMLCICIQVVMEE